MNISTNFDQNISHFHEILDISKNFDIVYRTLTIAGKNACLYFVDGFTKDEILLRLMQDFASVKPDAFSLRITCSNIGRPATGTRALGMVSVNGFRRLPKPAANIIAFIPLLHSCCFKRTFYILFTVHQFHFHSEFPVQTFRQMLG